MASCGSIKIPDSKICSASGSMLAGADCTTYFSHERTSMTFEEFVKFIEPTKERGGAICQPLSDFIAQKTAIEQACAKLGNKCSEETKEKIKEFDGEIKLLLDETKLP